MRLDVCICTHDPRRPVLDLALRSVARQAAPDVSFEVLVVDNASSPPLQEEVLAPLHRAGIAARLVREERPGLSRARLAAIRATHGDWMLFLDDDTELADGFVAEGLHFAASHPDVGCFGGKLLLPESVRPPRWARPFLPYLAIKDAGDEVIVGTGREWGPWEPPGAGVFVRREVLEAYRARLEADERGLALGRRGREGLASCEDSLLVRQAFPLGLRSAYVPRLVLRHHLDPSRFDRRYLVRLLHAYGASRVLLEALLRPASEGPPPVPPRYGSPLRFVRLLLSEVNAGRKRSFAFALGILAYHLSARSAYLRERDGATTRDERSGSTRRGLATASLALVCLAFALFRWGPPLQPGWDDAHFFGRAICVDRAALALDGRALAGCFSLVVRSPLLTVTALPWGGHASSPTGLGLSLVSLALLQCVLAIGAVVLLRSLRVPGALLLAAAASVALTEPVRVQAGRMMADLPLSLAVVLALLLVPLEARAGARAGARADVARGALWGAAFAVGLLAKMTFLLFAGILAPIVLALRWRASGARSALRTAGVALLVASPAFVITALSWKALWRHAKLAVAGAYAERYSGGMQALEYLGTVVASAPVLSVVSAAAALAFPLALRRDRRAALASLPGLLALALYGLVSVTSPNHDPRHVLPLLVGLPFALALPWARLDAPAPPLPARHAAAWAVAAILVSVPAVARYDFSNVLEQARMIGGLGAADRPARLVLATDSPTLDVDTLQTALELVPERKGKVVIDTVVYDETDGRDLAFSLAKLARSDYVVLQTDPAKLFPDWTNVHAEVFRETARATGTRVAELSTRDFEVYATVAPATTR